MREMAIFRPNKDSVNTHDGCETQEHALLREAVPDDE